MRSNSGPSLPPAFAGLIFIALFLGAALALYPPDDAASSVGPLPGALTGTWSVILPAALGALPGIAVSVCLHLRSISLLRPRSSSPRYYPLSAPTRRQSDPTVHEPRRGWPNEQWGSLL